MAVRPPPLPGRRISWWVLAAILLLLLSIVVRAFLSQSDELTQPPWQRLELLAAGTLSAVVALLCGVVACFTHRRTWPLSVFVALASSWIAYTLATELPGPFAKATAHIRQSAAKGVALARRPVPQDKETSSTAPAPAVLMAWADEAMVQPYEKHGHHDPAWDEDARQMIRGTALRFAGSQSSPGPAHLRALGARIRNAGCDDPYVLLLIRRLGDNDPDIAEAMAGFPAAVAGQGYTGFPLWLARAEALRAMQRDAPQMAAELEPGCLEALRAALSARPLEAEDYRAWCVAFAIEPGISLIKQDGEGVCRTVDSIPGMQEWFKRWLRACGEIEQAWLARGHGWANTVSAEQWHFFSEQHAAARGALERAASLNPKQPEIAKTLISVALGSTGLDEMRLHFDDAVRARFEYIPAYDAFRNGLRPRWFGSEQAQLAFGRNCVATQRFDTEVPLQMLRAVRDIAADQNDEYDYYKNAAPWDELKAMLDGYLAHGEAARRNYYLSEKAVLAGRRCLPADLAPMLKELDYHIDPQVVEEWNLPVQWAARMATLCGPACNLLLSAENQIDAQRPEAALQSLLTAQKISDQPPAVNDYLADRVGEVKDLIALKSAPWRPLMPPQDLSGWKVESGEWRVLAPSVLEVKPGPSDARLTRLQPIGDAWELRGEVELMIQAQGRAEAALFCGPPGAQEKRGLSMRFCTNGNDWSGISVARGFNDDAFSKKTDFGQRIPFEARMTNHRLRIISGKTQWIADQPMPAGVTIESGALLGLGSTGGNARTIQFRNLELRAPSGGN